MRSDTSPGWTVFKEGFKLKQTSTSYLLGIFYYRHDSRKNRVTHSTQAHDEDGLLRTCLEVTCNLPAKGIPSHKFLHNAQNPELRTCQQGPHSTASPGRGLQAPESLGISSSSGTSQVYRAPTALFFLPDFRLLSACMDTGWEPFADFTSDDTVPSTFLLSNF